MEIIKQDNFERNEPLEDKINDEEITKTLSESQFFGDLAEKEKSELVDIIKSYLKDKKENN